MCEFISWTEYKGELYYLTNYELNMRPGIEFKKKLHNNFYGDIVGHGAIKEYFGLHHLRCTDFECTDFSTPDNFPKEIIEDFKDGKFSDIGMPKPTSILKQTAMKTYNKIQKPNYYEYYEEELQTRKKYNKISIELQAKREYDDVEQGRYSEIELQTKKEYANIKNSTFRKHYKIMLEIFWTLFADPKNRIEAWK